MRVSVLAIAASFGMLVGQAWGASNLTEQQVRNVCGGGLQTGNGQTGCTKCGTTCIDYNCSDGTHGVPKGCKGVVIGRATPSGLPPNNGLGASKLRGGAPLATGTGSGSTGSKMPQATTTNPSVLSNPNPLGGSAGGTTSSKIKSPTTSTGPTVPPTTGPTMPTR
jgi:hypothetical protein